MEITVRALMSSDLMRTIRRPTLRVRWTILPEAYKTLASVSHWS